MSPKLKHRRHFILQLNRRLGELYDIYLAVRNMATSSYKPLKLPSDDAELKVYLSKNKIKMMEQVLDSIEHSLSNDLDSIEVFSFKGSDFIVTLNRECFLENVENIYKFYVDEEKYELCNRVKRVNLKLLKKYEKQKPS